MGLVRPSVRPGRPGTGIESLIPAPAVHRVVSEDLDLTMEALEELYRSHRVKGWDLKVYDYASNAWRDAEEAFSTTGTYERAVLTRPGTRPIRVRVMPQHTGGLRVDPGSAGEIAVWQTLGLDLRSRHLAAVSKVLEGRRDPVPLEEICGLLEMEEGDDAREARVAIMDLLSTGSGSS